MTVFTSSKGTQEKWLKDDYFYKRDFFGGEAEAEFLVSEFLKSCGIKDYVPYEKVGSDLCRSQNFIPEGGSFVTMFRLLQQRGYTESDIEQIAKKQPQEQYNFLKKELAEIGFSEAELDSIFARLFEIDRLTLNVDRHWNNFGIIFSKDEPPYLLTLFDFGYSLGVTFPRTMPMHVAIRKSKAMTVSKSFDKQCELAGAFSFDIQDSFIEFLKNRKTREAHIFLSRINKYYN